MIRYYFYKILNKILSAFLYAKKGKVLRSGVYEIVPRGFSFENKIVLAFWDRALVHLGDQLFHEALARYLIKNGFKVYVCGSSPLNSYFSALGAEIISLGDLKKRKIEGAIFVSKDDMAFSVVSNFGKKNSFIGINYAALTTEEKISLEISRIILDFIKKSGAMQNVDSEIKKINFNPEVPESILNGYEEKQWFKLISALSNKRFLVFNNYVASNFLDSGKREPLLENLCKKKKSEGFEIIHVGSKNDKLEDKKIYDFIDHDLRGELDPMALIKLFSLNNVEGVISFDTYVMHAASLFHKNLYIVNKNESVKEIFRKRFIPMYPGGEGTLKEYL